MDQDFDSVLGMPFKKYREAKESKKQSLLNEREQYLVEQKRLMIIILAMALDYMELYPNARGSILGRVKGYSSLLTKISNEFSDVQAKSNLSQEEIIKKISEIELKDIFATSVITDRPPQIFRTGNDDLDKKLSGLLNKVLLSEQRLNEHNDEIIRNEEALILKQQEKDRIVEALAISRDKEVIEDEFKEKTEKLLSLIKTGNLTVSEYQKIEKELDKIKSETSKEELQEKLEIIRKDIDRLRASIKYAQTNNERTKLVYIEQLSELQYEMSSYYAQNANQFSNLSFWKTKSIRAPKTIIKERI